MTQLLLKMIGDQINREASEIYPESNNTLGSKLELWGSGLKASIRSPHQGPSSDQFASSTQHLPSSI